MCFCTRWKATVFENNYSLFTYKNEEFATAFQVTTWLPLFVGIFFHTFCIPRALHFLIDKFLAQVIHYADEVLKETHYSQFQFHFNVSKREVKKVYFQNVYSIESTKKLNQCLKCGSALAQFYIQTLQRLT